MAMYLNGGITKVFRLGVVDYASQGYVKAFVAGTSTPKNMYPTLADAVAGTNPYGAVKQLDGEGQAVIAITGATDIFVYDKDMTPIYQVLGLDQAGSDVLDPNGNIILHYMYNNNAVNGWSMENKPTGSGPIFSTYGTDINIPGFITSKGSGDLNLDGGSTGKVILGGNSTGSIELRRDTVVTGSITAGGTPTNTPLLLKGKGTSGVRVQGDVSGTAIAAGNIGEIITVNNSVVAATAVATNVCILTLTPGHWVTTGFISTNTPGTNIYVAISLSSGVLQYYTGFTGTNGIPCSLPTPTLYHNVTVNTQVYTVISYAAGGTFTATGTLNAYRIG